MLVETSSSKLVLHLLVGVKVRGGGGEFMEEGEESAWRLAVLTMPLSLDGGLATEHAPPSIVQRILSLFSNVRPGSDLAHFQLPPLFNMPKSQLQCYGEGVYCVNEDLLGRCAGGKSSLERFTSVLAWSISTTRPPIFGLAPYNPILGETHHVSKGTLNVLLEQVSHHPPVSALHATDETHNLELIWCQRPVPKFYGASVEAVIHGKRLLKLLDHGEIYEMDAPNLQIKLFPVRGSDWTGKVRVQCRNSGLEGELRYCKCQSFLGLGGNSRTIRGKVFYSKSLEMVYEIDGQWDRIVTLKDVRSGEISILYNAREATSKLKAPIVRDPKGLLTTESALVWGKVSQCILKRDWERAKKVKRDVEERERKLAKERKNKGEAWVPRYFTITQNKEGVWECLPREPSVPPAPIVVP